MIDQAIMDRLIDAQSHLICATRPYATANVDAILWSHLLGAQESLENALESIRKSEQRDVLTPADVTALEDQP